MSAASVGTDVTRRILVVEDDAVDRERVARLLARSGLAAEVIDAVDVSSALKWLRAGGFDCVLTDYHLPGGDASGLLRAFRREGLAEVPVVVLTGLEDIAVGVRLVSEGAEDHLVKEATTAMDLRRAIEYSIERHRLKGRLLSEAEAALDRQKALALLQREQIARRGSGPADPRSLDPLAERGFSDPG